VKEKDETVGVEEKSKTSKVWWREGSAEPVRGF